MRKEKKDKHFIHKPQYKGGLASLRAFISQNLRYPEAAVAEKIEGSVYLRYDINYKGVVTGAKIITSLGYGCDEEAVRLVKLLRFEVPKNRGLKVVFHKQIRVHFRLPAAPEATAGIQANYTITKKQENEGNGYNYTVRY